jgi:hypothetical protein
MPLVPITDVATFQRAVVLGQTSEDRNLEFKSEYRWQKGKGPPGEAEELSRDVAAFANTDGGVLLVGVAEREDSGRRIADKIANIENVDGLKQWIEQSIRNNLTPSTFSRAIAEIVLPDGEGTILAVNIPQSLYLVAMWTTAGKKGIEYLHRTDHGKVWFNPDEVERQIMNGSRAMQIRLAQLFRQLTKKPDDRIQVQLTPVAEMWVGARGAYGARPLVSLAPVLCSGEEVELRVNAQTRTGDLPVGVRIPHGLIVEAWAAGEGRLGLCLKVQVVVTDAGGIDLRLAE